MNIPEYVTLNITAYFVKMTIYDTRIQRKRVKNKQRQVHGLLERNVMTEPILISLTRVKLIIVPLSQHHVNIKLIFMYIYVSAKIFFTNCVITNNPYSSTIF